MFFFYPFHFPFSIIQDNSEILTEIGILYLKINDTKSAFDKLFDVTKLRSANCSRAHIALGAILQVYMKNMIFMEFLNVIYIYIYCSQKTMLTVP